jgi:hypothetical protein
MNIRLVFRAAALLLAVSIIAFSDATTDEYAMLMKPAAAANGKMQKSIEADLAVTAASATEVKAAFQQIEQFWAKRGVADAQEFSKNVQQAADEVHAAATAGNKEQAMAAAKQIGANCQGCHKVHREKGADGSWMLK